MCYPVIPEYPVDVGCGEFLGTKFLLYVFRVLYSNCVSFENILTSDACISMSIVEPTTNMFSKKYIVNLMRDFYMIFTRIELFICINIVWCTFSLKLNSNIMYFRAY